MLIASLLMEKGNRLGEVCDDQIGQWGPLFYYMGRYAILWTNLEQWELQFFVVAFT